MDLQNSILLDIKESIGISQNSTDFDKEILDHINTSIGTLNQNGIGNSVIINDSSILWNDLIDVSQTEGNKYFQMVSLFISLSTKLIFDPPPPSNVSYYSKRIEEILWRLKLAYEQPYTTTTTTV